MDARSPPSNPPGSREAVGVGDDRSCGHGAGYAAPCRSAFAERLSHARDASGGSLRFPFLAREAGLLGPCPVYGWYPRSGTVYLDGALDLDHDLFARSVLVHELVHVLQDQRDHARAPYDCATWQDREREALRVQYRWLERQEAPAEAYFRLGMPAPASFCAE